MGYDLNLRNWTHTVRLMKRIYIILMAPSIHITQTTSLGKKKNRGNTVMSNCHRTGSDAALLCTAYSVYLFVLFFFTKFKVSLKLTKSFSMYGKQPLTNVNLLSYKCYKLLARIILLALHVIFCLSLSSLAIGVS